MPKTYVILVNTLPARQPYSAYVFNGRGIAVKWKAVTEHDFVFSTARELADTYDFQDLKGVCCTLRAAEGIFVVPTSVDEAAVYIYHWALKTATPYKPGMKTMAEEVNELDEAAKADERRAKDRKRKAAEARRAATEDVTVTAERKPRELKHKIYATDAVIVRKVDAPPIAAGSNRYRNMQLVMDSKTVGEALQKLRSATPPGVAADIDLAVAKGAVEIQ